MIDSLVANMAELAGQPWLIGLLLIVATFILEDPATVGGALLAADGLIHPLAAFAALYTGIVLGDLGLYGLGWLGSRNRRVQRFLERRAVASTGAWIGRRLIGTIIASRFVPGMRLPVYAACGMFGLSFSRFLATVLLAVAGWTAILFFGVYIFGEVVWDGLGDWRWAVGGTLIVLVVVLPRLVLYLKAWRGKSPAGEDR